MANNDRRERNRRLCNRLLRKIFAFLESGDYRINYAKLFMNKNACRVLSPEINEIRAIGWTVFQAKMILIDYRYDVLATLVHECLHATLHESFGSDKKREEKEVTRLERLIMRHMTARDAVRLHKLATPLLEE